MRRVVKALVWICLFLPLAQAGWLSSALRADDLLQYVDARAGLCVQVTGWKAERTRFLQSPLANRAAQSPVVRHGLDRIFNERWNKIREKLEPIAGRPAADVFDDLFGEEVVLAVFPPTGAEREPAGLLLLRARSPEVLQANLALWDRIDPAEKEMKSHHGMPYVLRRKPGARRGPPAMYFAALGTALAMSQSESAIQRVLELAKPDAADADRLVALPAYRQLQQSLAPECWARVFLNPRAWDGVLQLSADKLPEDPPRRAFAQAWLHAQSLGGGLRTTPDVVLEAVAHYDGSDLPTPLRDWLSTEVDAAHLLSQVPRESVFAWAGRNEPAAISLWLADAVPPGRDKDWDRFRRVTSGLFLGQDLLREVLPAFQTWEGYLISPPSQGGAGGGASPPSKAGTAGGERLQNFVNGVIRWSNPRQPEALPACENAGTALLNLLVVQRNTQHADAANLRIERLAGGALRWVTGLPDFQPTFATAGESLWLAGAPELIRNRLQPAAETLAADPAFMKLATAHLQDQRLIVVLRASPLRRFLEQHRDSLLHFAASRWKVSADDAAPRLGALLSLLNSADAAFIAVRTDEQSFKARFGIVAQ